MNSCLKFKSKIHSDAYAYDLELQFKKRMALVIFAAVALGIDVTCTYIVNPATATDDSKLLIGVRMITALLSILGLHILKRNIQRIKKHMEKFKLILDTLIIGTQFIFYPVVTNFSLDALGRVGLFVYAWATALIFHSVCSTIVVNWWKKLIIIAIQVSYFFIFVIKSESTPFPALGTTIASIAVFFFFTYWHEKFKRIDFLEKRKVYDNYEAIKNIFDDIAQGIIIVDKDNCIHYANRTIKTMLNLTQQNFTLRNILSQIYVKSISQNLQSHTTERIDTERHERNENQNMIILNQLLNGIKNVLFESTQSSITVEGFYQSTSFDRKVISLYIKFTASFFMEKQVLVMNITDSTDRDARIAAEASSEYKSRLLASVSHELRTPLNGTINFTEQALTDPCVPNHIKEKWLIPAQRSSRLLLSIINDILDFSQMHAEKLRMVYENNNIVDTAIDCIELLELQAKKRGVKLQLQNDLFPSVPMVYTDHNRLRQIILNLLGNAVKFTFKGEINLILEEVVSSIEGNASLRGVRVKCKDTGIGISPENQKKLFRAFGKIELGEKAPVNAAGVGLGLVISNNLVQRLSPQGLDGRQPENIKVISEEGVGSTFYFDIYDQFFTEDRKKKDPPIFVQSNVDLSIDFSQSMIGLNQKNVFELTRMLPRFQDSQEMRFDSEVEFLKISPAVAVCKCPKILIVDDDSFNLTALEQILSKLGLSCDLAFNGLQAIERIQMKQINRCNINCQQYNVVFMDFNMPIMDGLEATKKIREKIRIREIDNLKIIACTAFIQKADESKAKAAGMDEFCTKPIKLSTIKEKLFDVGFLKKL